MRLVRWLAILMLAISLCGCNGMADEVGANESFFPLTDEIEFDADDLDASFEAALCIPITLVGETAECASANVEIGESTVTIAKGGNYLISGELSGMLIVDADKKDTVRLILSDADIASPTSAAIYVLRAGKVVITAAEGTENHLSNGGEYIDIDENAIDAVIFSKDDLSINGSGSIHIEAADGHGIVGKDSLRLANVNLSINSAKHGITAKDDIGISGGSYTLNCGKDGIHAENRDDAQLGNLLILGGSFEIASGGDAFSAGNLLQVDGGEFKICSGGGHENAAAHADEFMRHRMSSASDESRKAFKSGGNMYINAGAFEIDASDDAFHTNADLRISGGSFIIRTGDDAMHADENLAVYGGEILILSSYEGLEGHSVDIYGGKIELTSDDDGVNAAGGDDETARYDPLSSDPEAYIHIYDGEILVRCEGDGIDSNGEIRISGGVIYVFGPTSGANGSLDSGTDAYIDGGDFCALGSYQMAEHFSEESGQCSMIAALSGRQGAEISVSDASGEVLLSVTAENSFECIVLSLNEFEIGEDYLLSVDDQSMTIHFDSMLYSASTSFGGRSMDRGFGGWMQRGGRGFH